jgi:hypothetical protein
MIFQNGTHYVLLNNGGTRNDCVVCPTRVLVHHLGHLSARAALRVSSNYHFFLRNPRKPRDFFGRNSANVGESCGNGAQSDT